MSASDQINKLRRKLQIQTRIAQREAAKELAQYIVDVVKLRTQQEGEGTKGSLKALKRSTVLNRERYSENLSSDTSPGKSNLTATGQLIDAIQGKSTATKATVTVNDKKRRGELSGSKSKLTNNEVRKYVEDAGREFLKLSKEEFDEVVDLATKILKEKLRDLS